MGGGKEAEEGERVKASGGRRTKSMKHSEGGRSSKGENAKHTQKPTGLEALLSCATSSNPYSCFCSFFKPKIPKSDSTDLDADPHPQRRPCGEVA